MSGSSCRPRCRDDRRHDCFAQGAATPAVANAPLLLGDSSSDVNLLDPALEQASDRTVCADPPLPVGEPCRPRVCCFPSWWSGKYARTRPSGRSTCRIRPIWGRRPISERHFAGSEVMGPTTWAFPTATLGSDRLRPRHPDAAGCRPKHQRGRCPGGLPQPLAKRHSERSRPRPVRFVTSSQVENQRAAPACS